MKPPAVGFMLITKTTKRRSGQVHQETLDMYANELKKRVPRAQS
jgi:hypothetical protein